MFLKKKEFPRKKINREIIIFSKFCERLKHGNFPPKIIAKLIKIYTRKMEVSTYFVPPPKKKTKQNKKTPTPICNLSSTAVAPTRVSSFSIKSEAASNSASRSWPIVVLAV